MTDLRKLYKHHKSEVDYVDKAMNPAERCGLCEYFENGGFCKIVRGTISPHGWCKKFRKKQ